MGADHPSPWPRPQTLLDRGCGATPPDPQRRVSMGMRPRSGRGASDPRVVGRAHLGGLCLPAAPATRGDSSWPAALRLGDREKAVRNSLIVCSRWHIHKGTRGTGMCRTENNAIFQLIIHTFLKEAELFRAIQSCFVCLSMHPRQNSVHTRWVALQMEYRG